MPVGKSVPITERGDSYAARMAKQMGVVQGVCRKAFLATELTHFQKHLTAHSDIQHSALARAWLRHCRPIKRSVLNAAYLGVGRKGGRSQQ